MDTASIRTTLTLEQVALLEANGMPLPVAHSSTTNRRKARTMRAFPVISRSGRTYTEPNGRKYGRTVPSEQPQADARYWRVGVAVREACEPMTVAEGGVVERIYEVKGWYLEQGQTKWTADLGPEISDPDLAIRYPGYPYRRGYPCPTRNGGAYRPEYY